MSHPSLLKVPDDLEVRNVCFSSISFLRFALTLHIRLSPIVLHLLVVVHQSYFKNTRNTSPLQKLLSSSTRALSIRNSRSSRLPKPMKSLRSSRQDTRGNTLKGAHMDLLSVEI